MNIRKELFSILQAGEAVSVEITSVTTVYGTKKACPEFI